MTKDTGGEGLRILLADDEEPLRRILGRELQRKGHTVALAEDGQRALRLLAEEEYDVAVLDVRMPGLDGLSVLRALRDEVGAPEVILLTGNATVETAVEAMKLGAYDFVTKPCRIEVLDALVRAAARKRNVRRENDRLKRREEHREPSPLARGWNSRAMDPVLRLIDRLAPSDLPVLVLGESGVGKEIVAREIHRRSRRHAGPFVDLNCAAIPDALLESELFGHEKGAFTGAEAARAGLMEAADGGTLFMDEVGELPAGLQVKLLRVLETMSFFRVGGRRKITVNVRLVAATNRDLAAESQAGRFRTDLYYRINAGTILVPPLRERPEEVQPLAEAFLAAVDSRGRFAAGVIDAMKAYAWPGNVRELRNVVERAALLGQGGLIGLDDLPREIVERRPLVVAGSPAPPAGYATGAALPSGYAGAALPSGALPSTAPVPPSGAHWNVVGSMPPPMNDGWSTGGSLQDMERQRIVEVLDSCHWHRGRAAEVLGISVRTLYRKIKAYGLDHEPALV